MRTDDSLELEESPFHESGDKDRYLITYADLITLLLGLFIILYAISNIDAHKYQRVVNAAGDIFGNRSKIVALNNNIVNKPSVPELSLKAELTKLIDKYHYNNSIRLEQNARGITIHLLDDILFASGSAN
ncbi:MAG: flagellar motor protein MotB, partial [Ignavibacteriaceae bacterium]